MSVIPTVSIRGIGDLVAAVPYLLGYEPSDALVLVCLQAGRVCMTACQPLPTDDEPPAALNALLAGMAKADPDAVIVLGFENTVPVQPILREAASACVEVGVRVHDRILVTGSDWRSLDRNDETGSDSGAPTGLAEFVGAGIAPLPSRNALSEALQPTDQAASVERHIDRYLAREDAEDLLELYCSAWPLVLDITDEAPAIAAKVAARAVLALRDVNVRDLLVARLTPGNLDADWITGRAGALLRELPAPAWETETGWDLVRARSRVQDRLIRLCAMTPDSHAAPVLSVLAAWAWWNGNGALARIALERALDCQPDYRLAQLLQQMLLLNIRPRE